MQLEHTFTVPADIDDAWKVLLDIEMIAPCMPGAALDSVDGDDFTGTVKVRLGPIGLTYKGKASFVEKDEAAHRAVIDAQGKDSRGNGTASAKVTATLTADDSGGGPGTKVHVLTDLNITGKPAQFGRGVMVDVGNKLIGQFADCLAGKLTGPAEPATPAAAVTESADAAGSSAGSPAGSSAGSPAGSSAGSPAVNGSAPAGSADTESAPVATIPRPAAARPAAVHREVEPIDLLGSAGPAVAKRLVPVVAGLALVVVLFVLRRRGCGR